MQTNMLPEDFDGVFRFTNWTDREFIGVWAKKEYHFPPHSTIPLVIPEHSSIEIQHIRKKFARDLAEQEFFRSQKYESMRKLEGEPMNPRLNSMMAANSYTEGDLKEYIQRCLEPLPVSKATVKAANTVNVEDKLTRDNKGRLNTKAVEDENDLVKMAKGE